MSVEFSEELKDQLDPEKTGIDVAASYVTKDELLKNYLNRPFGNAYDFDQIDKIEACF